MALRSPCSRGPLPLAVAFGERHPDRRPASTTSLIAVAIAIATGARHQLSDVLTPQRNKGCQQDRLVVTRNGKPAAVRRR